MSVFLLGVGSAAFAAGLIASSIETPDKHPNMTKSFPLKTANFVDPLHDIRYPTRSMGENRYGSLHTRNLDFVHQQRLSPDQNPMFRTQEFADAYTEINTDIKYGTRHHLMDRHKGCRAMGPPKFCLPEGFPDPTATPEESARLAGTYCPQPTASRRQDRFNPHLGQE
jgi:hypothetical protein